MVIFLHIMGIFLLVKFLSRSFSGLPSYSAVCLLFSQNFPIGSSVQDGMLSQDSTYQGDRNPNASDGGFLSQLWLKTYLRFALVIYCFHEFFVHNLQITIFSRIFFIQVERFESKNQEEKKNSNSTGCWCWKIIS